MTSALNWIFYYLIFVSIIILAADLARRYYNYRHQKQLETTLLELNPPASTQKVPIATEQLFTVLHSLASVRTFQERLLDRANTFSFEVVSSRHEGIRYLVRLPRSDVLAFEQLVSAYLPGVQFREVEDYLTKLRDGQLAGVTEFKQARHFAYPLAAHDSLSQHDPIAYIAGSMTMLDPEELVAFQVVVSPVSPRSFLSEVYMEATAT